MNNHDFKLKLIDDLKRRDVFFQQPSKIQIRTRCPFCGDSQKNLKTGHFYLRINPDDNYPVVYNCFKCPAKGILTYETLEALGISGNEYKENISTLNRTSDKVTSSTELVKDRYFEYELSKNINRRKVAYIENRLGVSLTDEDCYNLKIITSLRDFCKVNKIEKVNCNPTLANMLENQYIGFLTFNNSYILFRDLTEKNNIRWYKYPITEASTGQKLFYSIRTEMDIYTKEKITINLAEGVMDIASAYFNLGFKDKDNTLNIAVCGKYYNSTLKYLFTNGFIGSNITINIFSDRDNTFDTSIEFYRKILEDYSKLVGKMMVHYNLKKKDIGVPKDEIALKSYII